METTKIPSINKKASRIGLGTWAIGGWMWGGTNEQDSIDTVLKALEQGINLIDTAPIYGFGTSERYVGKAVQEFGKRDELILATKLGLDWDANEKVHRNASRDRILQEVEDSLKRLGTDHIDIYQVHWPDHRTPIQESAETLKELHEEGTIGAIGVSNHSPEQMDEFRKYAPLHVNQPPYNLFERGIEQDVLPYCQDSGIATLTYGALCRGLLSGKIRKDTEFEGDDLRRFDPKFKSSTREQYVNAADELDRFALERFEKRSIHLAVRWILEQGASVALWGARRPDQLDDVPKMMDWNLDAEAQGRIDGILRENIRDKVGPEFMAPPV